MKSPARTIDLRSANRQTVLRYLYFNGAMSRLELSQHSKLSPATVTILINELLKEGIVIETGLVESEGGRPRTILAVNPNYGYIVGIDLGETNLQFDLFDLTLKKLNAVRYFIEPNNNSPEKYIKYIVRGLEELIKISGIRSENILGLGLGLPGLVERNKPQVVASPIWKWKDVAFGEMLKQHIALPICLDNGAKAMTLAEAWFGSGREQQNLVTVLIGTGVGAGIISQGELYRGPTNSAGEFGHTIVVLDGRPCRCGSRGCLEAYVGALGIINTLTELDPNSPLLDSHAEADKQLAILNNILQAAANNDAIALQTLEITAHYLGAAMANLVNLFNPEKIVIGGWVGLEIGQNILGKLRQFLDQYSLPLLRKVVELDLCQLGPDAVCMGAACLVLDQFFAGNTQFMRRAKS